MMVADTLTEDQKKKADAAKDLVRAMSKVMMKKQKAVEFNFVVLMPLLSVVKLLAEAFAFMFLWNNSSALLINSLHTISYPLALLVWLGICLVTDRLLITPPEREDTVLVQRVVMILPVIAPLYLVLFGVIIKALFL
jgi:hypothetical protein